MHAMRIQAQLLLSQLNTHINTSLLFFTIVLSNHTNSDVLVSCHWLLCVLLIPSSSQVFIQNEFMSKSLRIILAIESNWPENGMKLDYPLGYKVFAKMLFAARINIRITS